MTEEHSKFAHAPLSTVGPVDCPVRGRELLNTPRLNKGTAFSLAEREQFGLTALLPTGVHDLEKQARRAWKQYASRPNDIAKNTFLMSLKDQNEVLYYKVIIDHLTEVFSVIYTPTEGDAIEQYSELFRRPEGIFLNVREIDKVRPSLAQGGRPRDIDYIVVTDGEEILGIGDQGVGGILISVAKLVVLTACAGIHPSRTLPVVLDCGTDNDRHLNDDLYLGLREKRVRGQAYNDLITTFVDSARELFPGAYIHFEDFGLTNARRILDQYRPRIPCFNDDVQGTGCVTLAAIMAALHVTQKTLVDTTVVIFGAGSAGVGIADQICSAIATEAGISLDQAGRQIYLIDKPGLLVTSLDVSPAQKRYLKTASEWQDSDRGLLAVIKRVRPTVLIGTSTVPGSFTKEIVQAMAESVDRPIILPLSNPTRLHEAVPQDLLSWTNGEALVATGSPFKPVKGPWGPGGGDIKIEVSECNNSVCFPGIGLGSVLCRARLVTDKMLVAAVKGVASMSPALHGESALLPGVDRVREVSVRVARNVIQAAAEEGVMTQSNIPTDDEELDAWIEAQMYVPEYRQLRPV